MNYAGSEEVRKDLEKLTEALYEVYRQAAEFESRYKWNKATLVERLTGAAVGIAKDELADVYGRVRQGGVNSVTVFRSGNGPVMR
ncbi:hypothetical protein GXE09_22940 [Salmonella enterica]|nr:hypothetical protein [Salmonella enterica]